jgi:hypothetical protein
MYFHASGAGGRWFKSSRPDLLYQAPAMLCIAGGFLLRTTRGLFGCLFVLQPVDTASVIFFECVITSSSVSLSACW